jgi:hypothetical protein
MTSPFGGPDFPSIGAVELIDVDRDGHSARLEWQQHVDEPKSRSMLARELAAASATVDVEAEIDSLMSLVSMSDSGTYVYDTDTGWPRSAAFVRRIDIAGTRHEERTEFERVDRP